jgi:hypothetical protein
MKVRKLKQGRLWGWVLQWEEGKVNRVNESECSGYILYSCVKIEQCNLF